MPETKGLKELPKFISNDEMHAKRNRSNSHSNKEEDPIPGTGERASNNQKGGELQSNLFATSEVAIDDIRQNFISKMLIINPSSKTNLKPIVVKKGGWNDSRRILSKSGI